MEVRKGYKLTEVGIVPHDWKVETVGKAFEICNNLRLPISEDIRKKMQGAYPYYGPTKIQDYINEYRIEGEYSLIGEDGDHFLKWREMSMTQLANGKFNVNNHAHLVRGRDKHTSTRWFFYYFKNRDITQFLTRQGAGRYKLSKAGLVALSIAIPCSLDEQTAIATVLSDADALISSLEKLIAKKRNIKQGAMHQLLQPKESWEVTKLGDVVIVNMGQSPDSVYYNSEGDGLPLIQGNADIENRKQIVRYWTSQITKTCDSGDLIMTVRAPVGAIGVATEKSCIGRGVCSFKPTNIEKVFLFHLMIYKESDWKILEQGSTFTAANSYQIVQFEFAMPRSSEEQLKIATVLSDMDNELAFLEAKLEKCKQIKQGMMQQLLTGKIRLV